MIPTFKSLVTLFSFRGEDAYSGLEGSALVDSYEAVEQMDIVAESVLEAEWERQYGDRVKHEWV